MPTDQQQSESVPPVTADDHRHGPDHARVTVVMYGDYASDQLRAVHATLKRLRQRLGDDLRLVFRHASRNRGDDPRAQFAQPDAPTPSQRAAYLAEAAADEGRFWELQDRLLATPGPLNDEVLDVLAAEFGLGEVRFEAGHPYVTRVDASLERAAQAGVRGTPTIYINGRRHDGSLDEPTLQAAIEAAR